MTTTAESPPRTTPRSAAIGSMIGTTIEWYDFCLYATATALVCKPLFFPNVSSTAGTLAAFGTYAVGFGTRPLGAVISGHLGDRVGRKAVLAGALLLMGIATTAIGVLPTYAQAGIAAPALLVVLRLVQGLAVGAEWGGAALLSVEHATPGRRGLFGSFTQLGSSAGMLLATGVYYLVRTLAGDDVFLSWAWRVPFLLSLVLVVVGLVIRLRLTDAPVFAELRARGETARLPVVEVLRTQPPQRRADHRAAAVADRVVRAAHHLLADLPADHVRQGQFGGAGRGDGRLRGRAGQHAAVGVPVRPLRAPPAVPVRVGDRDRGAGDRVRRERGARRDVRAAGRLVR